MLLSDVSYFLASTSANGDAGAGTAVARLGALLAERALQFLLQDEDEGK